MLIKSLEPQNPPTKTGILPFFNRLYILIVHYLDYITEAAKYL